MGCCEGSCSCGKSNHTPEQESVFLAQMSTRQGMLSTYDWMELYGNLKVSPEIVEVRFKNNRKEFFRNSHTLKLAKDDRVVVDVEGGHDIGTVSLTGDLAKKQYEKKGDPGKSNVLRQIYRKALQQDLNKWLESKKKERGTLIRSRQVAEMLGLNLSIGDVEFQGDGRKVTIFYTAPGRVDFRELIKHYASEFRVRIEMRQIGIRQEASRIGGIGSCGRSLCCSTWKTDFQSVKTEAARMQNLSMNAAKLAGQCGKLKCCLNYELEVYLEAWDEFPKQLLELETGKGILKPLQADILKGKVSYGFKEGHHTERYEFSIHEVKQFIDLNKKGKIIKIPH